MTAPASASGPVPAVLDVDDVVLCTLALPAPVSLVVDLAAALDEVGRAHGLAPARLLMDGTNRVVARRTTPTDRPEVP